MMYRNKKLLNLAKECPVCMRCGKHNDGTIVAAHSNQLRDGKGRGLKAHDYRIAYLCNECHSQIDQGQWSRSEKVEAWEDAHRATVGWLFESGHLEVK